MKNFQEIISNDRFNKTLILGNGFSKSIYQCFDYKNLFETSKSELNENEKISLELIKIFEALNTSDFEKVLANLNQAIKITNHYKVIEISNRLNDDIKKIKDAFIKSIVFVHPNDPNKLTDDTKFKLKKFLANFNIIFSTNYDALYYWLIMDENNKNIYIPSDDGFGYPPTYLEREFLQNPIWLNSSNQNIFYLHGGLHIFENGDIFKLKRDQATNLITKISSEIYRGINPLVVFEGKSSDKIHKINHNRYLWHAYERLRNINGSLYIFGHSLNNHADGHIIEAIRHSQVTNIYFGLYNINDVELLQRAKDLEGTNRSVEIFDSSSAITWECIT